MRQGGVARRPSLPLQCLPLPRDHVACCPPPPHPPLLCTPQFRFTLLCLAALEAPFHLALNDSTGAATKYGEDCVFVANDWHAALVPVYLAAKYRPHGVYKKARSILAIHNLQHQVRAVAGGWGFGRVG